MKIEFEKDDIEAIAKRVVELIKPILSSNDRQNNDDTIFDVKGLCTYLGTSEKWVYEKTHLKEIPHLKVKGLLRFREKDIDKWLNSFNVPNVNRPQSLLRVVK